MSYNKLTLTATDPLLLMVSPRMAEINDDLPHPTVPTTATNCPVGIERLMLCER